MKEVIFVILEGFADWEGAYIATCLNQGVKPGKEMTQLTEDKFLSVLGLSIHKQVNLSSQVIMIQTIITSMTKQIRMKS